MNRESLIQVIKETLQNYEEVLFAFLYGSSVHFDEIYRGDIDIAIYLKPMDMVAYLKKEEEITFALIKSLNNDKIDLRILNVSPFPLQYNVLKEGLPIFVRDEQSRVDFETMVMNKYFEMKPFYEEEREMLLLRIKSS